MKSVSPKKHRAASKQPSPSYLLLERRQPRRPYSISNAA